MIRILVILFIIKLYARIYIIRLLLLLLSLLSLLFHNKMKKRFPKSYLQIDDSLHPKIAICHNLHDCHIFSKYLVFQSKYLVFQSKYLVFRSKTLDFDQNTGYFESEILKY